MVDYFSEQSGLICQCTGNRQAQTDQQMDERNTSYSEALLQLRLDYCDILLVQLMADVWHVAKGKKN